MTMSDIQDRPALSRRRILRQTAAAATLALLPVSPVAAKVRPQACPGATCAGQLVYIGTQSDAPGQGIFAARLDPTTGKLTPLGLALEAQRPTWLAPHPTLPILYAVSEVGNDGKSHGSVATLRADPRTGALSVVSTADSGGGGPTHLSLDLPSKTLLAANYGTGQVAVLPVLADATAGPPASVQTDQGSGPSPRQKSAHAHGVALDPSRRFALVADLGADRIFIYRYDRKAHRLGASTAEALPPGVGPRHLAFHPRGRFLFVLSELAPELRSYRWDARRGRLALVQTLSASADPTKAGVARGAEVAVSRDGRFAYVSVRGEDVLVAYAVNPRTGGLTEIQRVAANGLSPWSFGADPSGRWMLVANQGSNTVVVFARDPATGRLSPTQESLSVNKPVSVAYLAAGSIR
jgi:6-phosphogluconolactonase